MCHPSQYKKRFCASYPKNNQCRRGSMCAFAHSRDEVRTPLLPLDEEQRFPQGLSDEFFMLRYKTLWCPVGMQHDWLKCPYAHNYQDARRPVSLGYGAALCPFWSRRQAGADYSQRCPLGIRCPFAHGAKEQLYHPHYFKTATCHDLKRKRCPRGDLCAFYHKRSEMRVAVADEVDYTKPLPEESFSPEWVAEFFAQPFATQEGVQQSTMAATGTCYFPWFGSLGVCPASGLQYGLASPTTDSIASSGTACPSSVPVAPECHSSATSLSPHAPAYIHMVPPGPGKESPRTQSTTSGDDEEAGCNEEEAASGDWFHTAHTAAWGVPMPQQPEWAMQASDLFAQQEHYMANLCAAGSLQGEGLWWGGMQGDASWGMAPVQEDNFAFDPAAHVGINYA